MREVSEGTVIPVDGWVGWEVVREVNRDTNTCGWGVVREVNRDTGWGVVREVSRDTNTCGWMV